MDFPPIHSLIRSRRKTLALHIMPDARLIVRAPLKLSEKEIHRFIQKKSKWILKTQQRMRDLPKPAVEKRCGRTDCELKAFYKKRAYALINERVKFYAEQMRSCPSKIRISNAKRRWGSCSSKGSLNFSWRLIMAPLFVLDSVVVHELAHLVVRNHSQKFWERVKKYFPEYQKAKRWLRENGKLLEL